MNFKSKAILVLRFFVVPVKRGFVSSYDNLWEILCFGLTIWKLSFDGSTKHPVLVEVKEGVEGRSDCWGRCCGDLKIIFFYNEILILGSGDLI